MPKGPFVSCQQKRKRIKKEFTPSAITHLQVSLRGKRPSNKDGMSPYGSVYTPSIIPSGCDNCKAVSPLEACYIRPKHCELLLHCVSASFFFPTEKMPPPNPVPMTSTPAIPVPKAKCLVCKKKTFKTAQALQDHQTALNHQPVPCPQCNKESAPKMPWKCTRGHARSLPSLPFPHVLHNCKYRRRRRPCYHFSSSDSSGRG